MADCGKTAVRTVIVLLPLLLLCFIRVLKNNSNRESFVYVKASVINFPTPCKSSRFVLASGLALATAKCSSQVMKNVIKVISTIQFLHTVSEN